MAKLKVYDGSTWQTIGGISSTTQRATTFAFDGSGVAPVVGTVATAIMPYNGNFTGWKIIEANETRCSIVLSIKKNGSTISGSEKPTLTSASTNSDLSLTTWTTSFVKGDIISATIDSGSGGTYIVCALYTEAIS